MINVTHLNQTSKAMFYVTKLNNDKVILGLRLCIDLLLISIHCDDKCQCKSHVLHETKKIDSEFPVGVDLKHTQHDQDVLPPVPISTKLNSDDVKWQIMELYPDLFSGVGTIKNAMVHIYLNQVLYQSYVLHIVFHMQFSLNWKMNWIEC